MRIIVGFKNYLQYYIRPKGNNQVHVVNLVAEKELSLDKKLFYMSKTRLQNYWNLIEKATNLQKETRINLNIDSLKHILKFDPSGETIGCGCILCAYNHKIYLLEKSIREVKMRKNILDLTQNIKEKGVIPDTFFNKFQKFNSFIFLALNQDEDELDKLRKKLDEKEVLLISELYPIKAGLRDALQLTGLPINNKSKILLKTRETYQKACSTLLNNSDLTTLDFNSELIPIAEQLAIKDVINVKTHLKNIQKQMNYIAKNIAYENQQADIYSPKLIKTLEESLLNLDKKVTFLKKRLISILEAKRQKMGYIA
jgi:hypothetical protein